VLERRSWVPDAFDSYVQAVAERVSRQEVDETEHELQALLERNRVIHERRCINLNPATNDESEGGGGAGAGVGDARLAWLSGR
jgi:hypothetical protein